MEGAEPSLSDAEALALAASILGRPASIVAAVDAADAPAVLSAPPLAPAAAATTAAPASPKPRTAELKKAAAPANDERLAPPASAPSTFRAAPVNQSAPPRSSLLSAAGGRRPPSTLATIADETHFPECSGTSANASRIGARGSAAARSGSPTAAASSEPRVRLQLAVVAAERVIVDIGVGGGFGFGVGADEPAVLLSLRVRTDVRVALAISVESPPPPPPAPQRVRSPSQKTPATAGTLQRPASRAAPLPSSASKLSRAASSLPSSSSSSSSSSPPPSAASRPLNRAVSSAVVGTSPSSPSSAAAAAASKSPAAASSLSRSQSLIGNLKPSTPVRDSFSAAGGGAGSALVSPTRRGDPLLPPMPQSTPPQAVASTSSRNLVRPTTSAATPSRGLGHGSSALGASPDLGSAAFAEKVPLAQDEAAESTLPAHDSAASPDWRAGSIGDGVTGAVTSPPPRGKASSKSLSVSPLSPLSIDPQLAARRASMGFNPLSPLVSPPPGHERRLPAHVTGAVESPTAWRIKLRAPAPPADGAAVKLTPGEAFKARKKAELMNGSKLAQEARRQSLVAIESKERAERARPADQVRLHVRTMDERLFVLDCTADDTVLAVKRRLAAKDAVHFAVAHQRLRCRALAAVRADGSDELDDDRATLGACGVQNDAIVHLLLEPGFGITVRTLIMSSEFPLHVYRDWTVCRLRRALEAAHGRARKGGSDAAAAAAPTAAGSGAKARPGMAARGSLSSSQPTQKSTAALAALTGGGGDAGMPGTFPFDPVAACRLTYRGATLRHDDARTLEAIGLFEGSVVFALLNDRLPPVDAVACDACGERWAPAVAAPAPQAGAVAGAAGATAAAAGSPSPLSPPSKALPASNELPASLSRW